MRLKEVSQKENLFGEEKFNIHSNRFRLFDMYERPLNETALDKDCDIGEIQVLETIVVSYFNRAYFVGYPMTHVKLEIDGWRYLDKYCNAKYGKSEEGGY